MLPGDEHRLTVDVISLGALDAITDEIPTDNVREKANQAISRKEMDTEYEYITNEEDWYFGFSVLNNPCFRQAGSFIWLSLS